ncbi:unnamed protein product [Adineta steineri]|uniref:IF rod domain-containing protein n=2 Tax=Adineta steineri TaxID=433720 RepID=A0A819FG54_9BILA|nr:unnamed protein product [Adineta steineri]CAF3865987.1 unnamed protein product [Adineta steineri]
MFAAFRRRAASVSRSDSNVKETPVIETNGRKTNLENGFATPTVTTNGTNTLNINGNNGLKHRTLSGMSMTSSSSSFSTSPTLNITRQQEKHELQTLNDRLAVIIDTVRRLEQDNEKLRTIVKTNTQSFEMETSKVKTLYENELEDAKKLIEELAHEKSRLEIELEKSRSETADVQTKAARNDRDSRVYESRLKQYENEISELKARYDSITLDAARRIEDNETLVNFNNDLEKQVSALKRQLESETLLRVDLENKNKTLREELQFNQQVYETKIYQIKEQQRIEIRHDDSLRQQYDARLLQELQQLRTQNEQEMQLLRDEIASQYEKKIEDLQNTNRRNLDQISSYRADLVSYRERIEEVTKTRDTCNDKMLQLEQRCRELEDRAYRAQQQQHESMAERDDEIQNLKQIIEQMQNDYQNLLDTKIGLDREISTYRKLLDSEEERLNIGGRIGLSPPINGNATPTGTDSLSTSSTTTTTIITTNGASQRQRLKRPRFEVDEDIIITNGNGH